MRFASLLFLTSNLYAGGYFEPNHGQSPSQAQFLARTRSGIAAIESAHMRLRSSHGPGTQVTLENADPRAAAEALDPIPGVSHYALKPDPQSWIYGVPHFGALVFRNVYPGIDLRYHLAGDSLEFDLDAVSPASIRRIRFRFTEEIDLGDNGDLVVPSGIVHRPIAWQTVAGERHFVDASYRKLDRHRASLRLGPHDPSLPVTIDPTLDFATFLGGSDTETNTQMIVDLGGNIYLAGSTTSVDFPASLPPGSFLNTPISLDQPDIYVSRLTPDGTALVWSFFLGGTATQNCTGLSQDSFGNIYLLGTTTSANFPVTPGAWKTSIDPSLTDSVVVKLDAQTGAIRASSYLGLTTYAASAFAIDPSGGVYASGAAGAAFRATPGAYLPASNRIFGAGVAVGIEHLNSDLTSVLYATWVEIGIPNLLAADASGNLIFTGRTVFITPPPPFPAVNPIPGIGQTPGQAFIAKLDPTFSHLVYASLFGSATSDLQVDSAGNAWVAGYTTSNFPQVNPLLLDPVPPGFSIGTSPFYAVVPPQGGGLLQSTLFYGPTYAISSPTPGTPPFIKLARPGGRFCITGLGISTQTPGGLGGATPQSGSSTLNCADDTGTTLGIKTIIPPTDSSYLAVQATPDGALLFAGTADRTLQTTPGVVQPVFAGSGNFATNAFLLRVSLTNPSPQITSVVPDSVLVGAAGTPSTWSFALMGTGFGFGTQVTFNGQPVSSTFESSTQIGLSGLPIATVQAGDNQVGASLVAPGGGVSSPIHITAYNPTPGPVSINPSSVSAGSPQTTVSIIGSGISTASTVVWNDSVHAATFVPSTLTRAASLQITLSPLELAQAGVVTFTVSNPAPGGGTSPAAQFAIQPVSGPIAPSLTGPAIFFIGQTTSPTVTLTGAGFAATSVAYWDGAVIPSTFVSATQLTVTPPAAELARVGSHIVSVSNGSLSSANLALLVGHDLNGSYYVYDPTHQLLYVASQPTAPFTANCDMTIYDIVTGNPTASLPAATICPSVMAISDDGSYVYVAGGSTQMEIQRFNTHLAAVDLDWQVGTPPMFSPPSITAMAVLTGSPQSLAVVAGIQVIIFDGNQPRPLTGIATGQQFALFASPNRVFLLNTSIYPCLTWLNFDAAGFESSSGSCGLNPPELVINHGFAYLSDGARTYTLSVPPGFEQATTTVPGASSQQWTFDLPSQTAYGVGDNGVRVVLQVNLNTLKQTIRLASSEVGFDAPIYLTNDGSLRLVSGLALLPVP